jgi:hypothetical protein
MNPHRNIHKYTWTTDGKPCNQIDHILIDDKRHPSASDVRTFMRVESDTDQHLVVEEVRERLAVIKRSKQTFYIEKFSLKYIVA